MAILFRYPLAFPPTGVVLGLLCLLYLLPGVIGHDPWKADDVVHIVVAQAMLVSGDLVNLRMAGEVYLDNPPLYYWVAALCAKLFAPLLPIHDAARLASAVLGGVFLAAVAGAANEFYGAATRSAAILITMGCLGLLLHIHEALPQNAVLAAMAGTFWGLALFPRKPAIGGVLIGVSTGLGFLAGGLPAVALIVPPLLLTPLVCRTYRTRRYLGSAALALAVATCVAATWPLALARSKPELFVAWWGSEISSLQPLPNISRRFLAYLGLLPWFAWPALPLAAWTLWRQRSAFGEPGVAVPMLGFCTTLAVLGTILEPRPPNALPILLPLVLLAAPAANTLRRGAANGFDWFSMMTFTVVAGIVWLGWFAMLKGWPPVTARNLLKFTPGFTPQLLWPAFVAALALTLAWLWLIFASPRSPQRGTVHWAAGTILMWSLVSLLWLPWLDFAKSYRSVSVSLAKALPRNVGCIDRHDVGEAQRASLYYFNGIITRDQPQGGSACRWLLEYATGRDAPESPPGPGWRKIWEDRRPSDRQERFRLYRRE